MGKESWKDKFRNVRVKKYKEHGGKLVYVYTAEAKRNTPNSRLSFIGGGTTRRVHIGTYVPSTGKTFDLKDEQRFAAAKNAQKTRRVATRRKYSRQQFNFGGGFQFPRLRF